MAQEALISFATLNLLTLSPANLAGRRFPPEMLNAVLNEETGDAVGVLVEVPILWTLH